jgi:hypothetical protein
MKKTLFCCLIVLVTLFSAATLSAQIVYNSRTTYNVAHPSSYIIDFNSDGPSGTFYPGGLTKATPFGNVTFDGIHTPPPDTGAVEAVDGNVFGVAGSGNLVLGVPGGQFLGDSLLITLPANSLSFGTDFLSPSQTVPEPYKFTIFSGSTVLGTATPVSTYGSYTFFGFDSLTSPITSVAVQIFNGIGSPEPIIDNFTLVPEPATWSAGIGAAAAMLVAGRRFRGKRA